MRAKINRIGFACVTYELGYSTTHSFRMKNLNEEKLQEAVSKNLNDMEAILGWMEHSGLRMFRIGSSFVPFASHENMRWDWKKLCASRLRQIGGKYAALGFRFSMHPGQYNVLNSPNPEVAKRCIAELDYSCMVLDLMGLDASSKVIIHAGGVYGDREASLKRIVTQIGKLKPAIRKRLVLENDDRHYTFEEVLHVSLETGIPALFDLLHHVLNPCDNIKNLLQKSRAIWGIIPEVHISSQKTGARPGAHGLFINDADLSHLLDLLPFEADLMVEAKGKEKAAIGAMVALQKMGMRATA